MKTSNDINPQITSGTYSYLDAGGTQDIVEVTNTSGNICKIIGITVDCNVLTQNGTLGLMIKVDSSNYREVAKTSFTVASDDSCSLFANIYTENAFKFTWLEGADEGAARDLPYEMSYEII